MAENRGDYGSSQYFNNGYQDYQIRWAEKDLVIIEAEGDEVLSIASVHSDGFHNLSDVYDQAADALLDWADAYDYTDTQEGLW